MEIAAAIILSPRDNTATLLSDVRKGAVVRCLCGGERFELKARMDIPFGHKIAIRNIQNGTPVIKYGEEIGLASRDIVVGEHVHVGNCESERGRGDLAAEVAEEDALCPEASAPTLPKDVRTLEKPLLNADGKTFLGYPRPDGAAGTRNLVAVISCVVCANDIVSKLGEIEGAAGFTHQQGCSQTKPDIDRIHRVLVNLAANPNVGAVLYLSLGCESVPSNIVAEEARKLTGKPVELLVIQKEGGSQETIKEASKIIESLKSRIARDPQPVPIQKLRLGLKCGSSDTTQGLSANAAAGAVTDILAACGAQVVIGETTEFMGAEHIAARRARTPAVAAAIAEAVRRMEDRARAVGVDMRGGQPTRGNIAGGLTTIEEKSLGALAKSGSAVFEAVVDYGEPYAGPGLVMMDAPGREPEMLTGLAAAGCNLILFTTGRGAPQGFPFVPVIKVTGNQRTWEHMQEHMDSCVAGIMTGDAAISDAAGNLFNELIEFASGRKTKAEITRYNNSMNIYVTGPVI